MLGLLAGNDLGRVGPARLARRTLHRRNEQSQEINLALSVIHIGGVEHGARVEPFRKAGGFEEGGDDVMEETKRGAAEQLVGQFRGADERTQILLGLRDIRLGHG